MLLSMSPSDLDVAITLYDHLLCCSLPKIINGHLKLSCVWFPVRSISLSTNSHYIAKVPFLGEVKIKMVDELSNLHSMVLVHPWFRHFLKSNIPMDNFTKPETLRFLAALRQPFGALPLAENDNSVGYKCVAVDQLIMVKIPDDISPKKLLEFVQQLFIH